MKVIDLIVKLANKEVVPDKIIWSDEEYRYHKTSNSYVCDYSDIFTDIDGTNLNDKVEVIGEELKKIDSYICNVGAVNNFDDVEKYIHTLFEQQSQLIQNQNNIIERLKNEK